MTLLPSAPSRASHRMLAALVLALALAPALVAADHVYSHRYVVDGRLVGSDGFPLPGRVVSIAVEGGELLEACRDGSTPVTDEHGDFRFCYHAHDLPAGARVVTSYGNVSAARGIDVAFRRSNVLLREPNETGVPTPVWNTTYRLSGRAWMPGPTKLEGVDVFGEAVIDLPVNLTVHAPDGGTTVFNTRTDGFGDFDLEVETEGDPTTLTLSLEALGRGQPTQLEAFFHRTYATIYVPPAGAVADPEDDPPATASGGVPAAPGSATPRVNPVLVVALVLALVVAIVMSKRAAK